MAKLLHSGRNDMEMEICSLSSMLSGINLFDKHETLKQLLEELK
jgi:hypothetical protein